MVRTKLNFTPPNKLTTHPQENQRRSSPALGFAPPLPIISDWVQVQSLPHAARYWTQDGALATGRASRCAEHQTAHTGGNESKKLSAQEAGGGRSRLTLE